MKDTHKYDDIIHLPHPVSATHPQMPLADRAAQFSPFSALTGHEDAIRETRRLTEEWAEPDEDRKARLDERLQIIRECLAGGNGDRGLPEIQFTYFQPDEKKNGGAYLTVTGRVKKIEEYDRRVALEDGRVLDAKYITDIKGALFRTYEDSEIQP